VQHYSAAGAVYATPGCTHFEYDRTQFEYSHSLFAYGERHSRSGLLRGYFCESAELFPIGSAVPVIGRTWQDVLLFAHGWGGVKAHTLAQKSRRFDTNTGAFLFQNL
jgi:hypothetical protein